jgi:hypothetical protein
MVVAKRLDGLIDAANFDEIALGLDGGDNVSGDIGLSGQDQNFGSCLMQTKRRSGEAETNDYRRFEEPESTKTQVFALTSIVP